MQHAPISRARYMQENRKMRFQEAFGGWNLAHFHSKYKAEFKVARSCNFGIHQRMRLQLLYCSGSSS